MLSISVIPKDNIENYLHEHDIHKDALSIFIVPHHTRMMIQSFLLGATTILICNPDK